MEKKINFSLKLNDATDNEISNKAFEIACNTYMALDEIKINK